MKGNWLKKVVADKYGEKALAELCWRIDPLPRIDFSDMGEPYLNMNSPEFQFYYED